MYYLALQNTYHDVQLALMHEATPLANISFSKMSASKELISHIQDLLTQHKKNLQDLAFIAVNCGPGPFTTLRVIITTADGIAYASGIPLVGINALHAAQFEWKNPQYPTTAILFNAFGNDVYCYVEHQEKKYLYGVFSIDVLFEKLMQLESPIRFLGNGAHLHHTAIQKSFGQKALFSDSTADYCSLSSIALMGLKKYKQKETTNFLLPVYLKHHPAAL